MVKVVERRGRNRPPDPRCPECFAKDVGAAGEASGGVLSMQRMRSCLAPSQAATSSAVHELGARFLHTSIIQCCR
jgi:hypothetical protein